MINSSCKKSVFHVFGSGETVEAIIKKYNRHDVHAEELPMLVDVFKMLNSNKVIRPGSRAFVPILNRMPQAGHD